MSVSTLDVQEFVKRTDLSLKKLQSLKKCDLTAIAQYLDVELTPELRKAEILDLVASHMELKEQTETPTPAQTSDQTQLELAKLKLEMDRERMRLEFEEKQKEREKEEKQKEREREEKQREAIERK